MGADPSLLPQEILIVDDHQVFAEVLALRLSSDVAGTSIRVAGSVSAARAHVRALEGGLVLLDYHLGNECGLDLLPDLDSLAVRPAVVVLSASHDPDEIVAALRAGVDAWILKSEGYDALVEVSLDARRKIMHLPSRSLGEVVRRLLRTSSDQPTGTFLDTLTRREHDVLELLVEGLSRDDIAARMFVSPHTVRTHVQHLHHRAGVHSTVALVAKARESGLGPRTVTHN